MPLVFVVEAQHPKDALPPGPKDTCPEREILFIGTESLFIGTERLFVGTERLFVGTQFNPLVAAHSTCAGSLYSIIEYEQILLLLLLLLL